MRKILGTLAILAILYVGFCGIKINDYEIKPFIAEYFSNNDVTEDISNIVDSTESAIEHAKTVYNGIKASL